MILPSAWPQVMDFLGTPLLIEPWPGQLSRDPELLPLRRVDQAIGLNRAFTQALDDPAAPTLRECYCLGLRPRRVGNKIGPAGPMWL